MGCGQSKIHLYPRKSKSKANGKKGVDSDADTDEDAGHLEEKSQNRDVEKNSEIEELNAKDAQETDEDVSISLLRAKNLSLLQSQEISSSQQNFFRMLDKKIEEGPDYDSASETEIALEEARLNALVQHWESVSRTASFCSSASRSLQTTPVRQITVNQITSRILLPTAVPSHVLNATDFLPHGALQSNQISNSGPMTRLPQNQQQLLLTQMNTMNSKMLQQMAAASQMPLGIENEAKGNNITTSTTASNTSTSLTLIGHVPLQPPSQHHYTHVVALPSGPTQMLPTPNVSPRRITTADGRFLINPLASQQIQGQYLVSPVITTVPSGSAYVLDSARPVPTGPAAARPMKQTCFTTAQQNSSIYEQLSQQPTSTSPSISQSQSQQYYGDVLHSMQTTAQLPPTEYRFPSAISVQRLAPQVQRQLRETQELIKDSCPLYVAGYGSPGPPKRDQQSRNPTNRRPTLETQFSQELS